MDRRIRIAPGLDGVAWTDVAELTAQGRDRKARVTSLRPNSEDLDRDLRWSVRRNAAAARTQQPGGIDDIDGRV